MIRRPPRSTLDRSSAASDVYKRQLLGEEAVGAAHAHRPLEPGVEDAHVLLEAPRADAVSYTHLRAHETVLDLVCRLLLEKKKKPDTVAPGGTRGGFSR